MLDICMDDAMIDGPTAMREFLLLLSSEPDIARVLSVIDSSSWGDGYGGDEMRGRQTHRQLHIAQEGEDISGACRQIRTMCVARR